MDPDQNVPVIWSDGAVSGVADSDKYAAARKKWTGGASTLWIPILRFVTNDPAGRTTDHHLISEVTSEERKASAR